MPEFNPYDPSIYMGAGTQVRLLRDARAGGGPLEIQRGTCGLVVKADGPSSSPGEKFREVKFDIVCGLSVFMWVEIDLMEMA